MIFLLFLYVADVFVMAKQHPVFPPLSDYYEDLPVGDPINVNYGISDFWWEDRTTKWKPWWEKMNMTKPDLDRTFPVTDPVEETTTATSETSKIVNETVAQPETTNQNETTAASQTDTGITPKETFADINSTTELISTTPAAGESTITDTAVPLPAVRDANLLPPLRFQQGLHAPAAGPAGPRQILVRDNPPHNYDYYGELHDDIPPNVRGPEYPGLSPDIPVIHTGTGKKTMKRLPSIPGWRLQFPDKPPKKDKISDGTPNTEKMIFKENYDDYFNVINDRMKVEPVSDEGIGRSVQPAPNGDKNSSVARVVNSLRVMDYPSFPDMPVIPESIEVAISTYSTQPFNFDEIVTGKEFLAQFSRAGPEGMIMPTINLNAIKAMSPTYTVPHEEPAGTSITRPSITSTTEPTTTTGFTAEPTTTTGFTTEPTTTRAFPQPSLFFAPELMTTTSFTAKPTTTTGFTTEPTITITFPQPSLFFAPELMTTTSFTAKPTTTTGFSTKPTTTRAFPQPSLFFAPELMTTTSFTAEPTTTTGFTTEPTFTMTFPPPSLFFAPELMTITSVTSTTQPSTTINYSPFNPAFPSDYTQGNEGWWLTYSTHKVNMITDPTQEVSTEPSTTIFHPLVEEMKREMELRHLGYFSISLEMFFKIFSNKENNALTDLLRGGSEALRKMSRKTDLQALGRPIWPGTELGFLQMRLAPIESVKRRASIVYQFYTSGIEFEVKQMHESLDNFFYKKDGEALMQAIAEFDDFPGVINDMKADLVMEHIFTALLTPFFREKNNPKMLTLVKEVNRKLMIASKRLHEGGDGRRNTPGKHKHTSTTKNNFKNKVVNIQNYKKRNNGDNDYDESDDTSEIPDNNFEGNESNNVVELKDGIDETKTFHDSYEDIQTEKIQTIVVVDNNEKFKNTKEYDSDNYIRMSKDKVIGSGIVDMKAKTTDTGKKEKTSKKIKCYSDECTATDTNTLQKRASKIKYGQNEDSYRNDESKVRLLKNPSYKTRVQFGHLKQTEMDLIIKHKITGAAILYDHDKYIEKKPKKYTKRYNNAKQAFASSKNDHDNRPLKDTKEKKIHHTNRARNGKADYNKLYLDKSEPNLVKYGNEEPKKYPKTYKKAKKATKDISIKDEDNRLSKEIKENTTDEYYAKNGKTNDKKFYLETFKNNKLEPKTYDEYDKKIGNVKSKDKINRKTEYISGTYEKGPILQSKSKKSKNIRITKTTSKISDFSHKTTNETHDYETYDEKTESDLSDKKDNNISTYGKTELSKSKDDDYYTFDNHVNIKKIKHSKTTNTLRKDEPNYINVKRNAFRNSVKAKDYIKELRIRRTTKGKEYFKDIKQYYTTISNHTKTFPHKKIYKKYHLKTQNHKIWSSENIDPNGNNATENEVPRYENKKVLEDWNAPRAKNIKNINSEDNVDSFENEVKKNNQEANLEQNDIQYSAKQSKTLKNTKFPGNTYTKRSERVLQKRFKQIQNTEAINKKHNNFSQSSKPEDVYSEEDLELKNKTENIFETSESSHNENNEKYWPHSKSQYIVNHDTPYLNERFLDFNRDNAKFKKKNILRTLEKNINILRDESSYSDDEEVLKSNLQDNLLHGGRNFTDTLLKYKKINVIRDISSYSDEEDTLKKNIYKMFT